MQFRVARGGQKRPLRHEPDNADRALVYCGAESCPNLALCAHRQRLIRFGKSRSEIDKTPVIVRAMRYNSKR